MLWSYPLDMGILNLLKHRNHLRLVVRWLYDRMSQRRNYNATSK